MNPPLNDQRAPLDDYHHVSSSVCYSERASPPILWIDGRSKDLSNLCLPCPKQQGEGGENECGAPPLAEQEEPSKSARMLKNLYPSCDDFFSNSCRSLAVDDIFDQAPLVGRPTSDLQQQQEPEQQQNQDSSPSSQRPRASSIDIDRFDDWIVEPIDPGKQQRTGVMKSIEDEKGKYHDHQLCESTVEETESSQHYFTSPAQASWNFNGFATAAFPPPSLLVPPEEPMLYPRPPSPPKEDYYYYNQHPSCLETRDNEDEDPYYYYHQQHHLPRSPTRNSSSRGATSDWLNYQLASDDSSYSYCSSNTGTQDRHATSQIQNHCYYQQQQQTQQQQQQPLLEIEVSPGEFWPLRGAEETIRAMERGQAQRVSCLACGLILMCLSDCLLVVCPDCMCLSPTAADTTATTTTGGGSSTVTPREEVDTYATSSTAAAVAGSTTSGLSGAAVGGSTRSLPVAGEEEASTTDAGSSSCCSKVGLTRPNNKPHGVGLGLKVGESRLLHGY